MLKVQSKQYLEGWVVGVCPVIFKTLHIFGVKHSVLPWPESSAVNLLEREHQMTNTSPSCWVFICHFCLCDKAFPVARNDHLTGLPRKRPNTIHNSKSAHFNTWCSWREKNDRAWTSIWHCPEGHTDFYFFPACVPTLRQAVVQWQVDKTP